MEPSLESQLMSGETLTESHRLHGIQMVLPGFFLVVGIIQFTPWSFGAGASLAGTVAIAYGLFTGALFYQLYRYGRVGLSSFRLLYLQKTPLRAPELMAWDASNFDAVMVRKGVFGKFLGYGHLMLLKSGRLVTVIRSVRGLDSLVPKIETELLKKRAS